ncbi:MAG TPA: cardiolipin synthase [Bacteriovoracaceae bacterium]|nr:cardiolipin synthase [Bacteriovoracaceae bacterium]
MNLYLPAPLIYLTIALYILGIILAVNSAFEARTPQGTMAWILGLTFFPIIAIPLFILFGKRKLDDYVAIEEKVAELRRLFHGQLKDYFVHENPSEIEKFLSSTEAPFVSGNKVSLLLNGTQTFEQMLEAIDSAEKYVLLQTYIFRTDQIGKKFVQALIRRAQQGVSVYLLYENLGIEVDETILQQLREAGVKVGEFPPMRKYKMQLNFRNHRKLLVVDGSQGIFGGINIGDDYLGLYPEIGFWRDTNIKVTGPGVIQSQIDFVKDWVWSQGTPVEVQWAAPVATGESSVLTLTSGPADHRHFNLLQHIEVINSAKKRLWIANPYFVPPQGLVDALFIARLRGVDVRLVIPANKKCDNKIVSTAAEVYLEQLTQAGIRVYKYKKGMMHQKVLLIDHALAIVGSSNLDFRSMYINFENAIATTDREFIDDTAEAFEEDFSESVEAAYADYENRTATEKLRSHLANCLTPIL